VNLLIASVGDRTTERLIEFDLHPNLEVIDGIERRTDRDDLAWKGEESRILRAENKAGGINPEALHALARCFELVKMSPLNRVRLSIEGEEDLLVLPIVAFYPARSISLYGQPGEGLVIVDSQSARETCRLYLQEMGITKIQQI
jgi:GTP-dependent dephospho-CoA kinase